jgi:hypothetical protein
VAYTADYTHQKSLGLKNLGHDDVIRLLNKLSTIAVRKAGKPQGGELIKFPIVNPDHLRSSALTGFRRARLGQPFQAILAHL